MSTSASSTDRWLACSASEALPHAKDAGGEPARKGRAIHRFLQAVTTRVQASEFVGSTARADELLEPAFAQARADGVFEAVSALDLDALPTDPRMYSAEMWMAWKPGGGGAAGPECWLGDEAALVSAWGHSRADATNRLDEEGYYFGAADVAAIDRDARRGLIVDYKTGEGYVKHPREHAQVAGLSFLLAKCAGLDEVDARIILLQEGEEPRTLRHVFGKEELAEIEERIRVGLERVRRAREDVAKGAPVNVYQGEHCRFCPAFSACPAKTALVRAMLDKPAEVEAEVRALLTPENTGAAYLKVQALEDLVGRVKRAVREAAVEFGGVPLPDGRVYGPVPGGRAIDSTKAVPALQIAIGHLFAEKAAPRKVTWASIEGAADFMRKTLGGRDESIASRVTKKEYLERAEEALEKAGALKEGEPTVRVHKP